MKTNSITENPCEWTTRNWLVRWLSSEASLSKQCIADLMFCNGTQTMGFCHCCSINMVGKTSCSHFSSEGSYYGYTHTWTKLHNEVMSWISGPYEHHWSELNYTVPDLTVPSLSSLPLSVMVCSCHSCVNLSHHCSKFFHADIALWQVALHRRGL